MGKCSVIESGGSCPYDNWDYEKEVCKCPFSEMCDGLCVYASTELSLISVLESMALTVKKLTKEVEELKQRRNEE